MLRTRESSRPQILCLNVLDKTDRAGGLWNIAYLATLQALVTWLVGLADVISFDLLYTIHKDSKE